LSWKEALERLRKPFSPEDLLEGRPSAEAVLKRLDEVQEEGLIADWWQEYRPIPGNKPALVCALFVRMGWTVVRREGVGEGESWDKAALEALRNAAWTLGVGRGKPSHLEPGAREAVPTPASVPTPTYISAPPPTPAPAPTPVSPDVLPTEEKPFPTPPPNPELAKKAKVADDFIRGIVEELKEKGKGKEAAQLILEYGYKVGEPPATEEELNRARELYKRLRHLAFGGKEA